MSDVETLKTWLRATELALECEEVPRLTIERVINRLLYGNPDPNTVVDLSEQTLGRG